jgi:site-specific recombinase XerD
MVSGFERVWTRVIGLELSEALAGSKTRTTGNGNARILVVRNRWTVADAVGIRAASQLQLRLYHQAHDDVADGTKRNRRRTLRLFDEFLSARGVKTVDAIDLDTLNSFRPTRKVSPRTWVKELESLRHFGRFCCDNDWAATNLAERVQMPRNIKPSSREPYQPAEIGKIVAACDKIGLAPYERLRARAMVLLLRYTALRISDVALLERSRVRNGEVLLRTTKNGKVVRIPAQCGTPVRLKRPARSSRRGQQ